MPTDRHTRALELLQKLARQQLPVSVTDPAELEQLGPLKSAGYLIAAEMARDKESPSARVCIITHKGWLALSPRVQKSHRASAMNPS